MDKTKRIIGLAKKAGALIIGTESVLERVRAGKAFIVIIAADASENTQKRIRDKCAFYKAEYDIPDLSGEELGAILGRGKVSAAAITDINFYNGYKQTQKHGNAQIVPTNEQDPKEVDAYGV